MMVFKKTHISRILSVFVTLAGSLMVSACFDIPSQPSEQKSVSNVSVYIKQGGKIDSSLLKIHPQADAMIIATAHPSKYTGDLDYEWYKEGKDNKSAWLGNGEMYLIPKNMESAKIPNKLIAKDAENNEFVLHFDIVINTPPTIDSITKPLPNDTLYGNTKTSFQFEWYSHDKDNEDLTYTILMDDKSYVVGEFNSIRQSGFSAGEHTFQVIVTDNYGDSDTSDVVKFFLKGTEGKNK